MDTMSTETSENETHSAVVIPINQVITHSQGSGFVASNCQSRRLIAISMAYQQTRVSALRHLDLFVFFAI